MSDIETVAARLSIEMYVDCPNSECGYLIDLLDEKDTDGYYHDDCGDLLKQMFPSNAEHADFKCEDVTCSQCKTTFNVKELEW